MWCTVAQDHSYQQLHCMLFICLFVYHSPILIVMQFTKPAPNSRTHSGFIFTNVCFYSATSILLFLFFTQGVLEYVGSALSYFIC